MTPRVWKVRRAADQDVDEIATLIAQDQPDAAIRFIHATRDAFELLASYPKAGPIRRARSSRLSELRSWPLGSSFRNYLVFYIERDFGVEILRVVHGARDVSKIIDELR